MSVVQLMRGGTLDAELAGLLWLLVEARTPLVVAAGPSGAGKSTLLHACLQFLPPDVRDHELGGYDEDFAWLPEARRLGWHPDGLRDGRGPGDGSVNPRSVYLLAHELSPHLPIYTWGEQARIAVRAASVGYGLGATVHGESLEDVFAALQGRDVGLTGDELTHLGVVLILRAFRAPSRDVVRRVVAAHYVRPISRDAGGHVQRPGPAVLATLDPQTDTFEHFSWGVMAELAARAGLRPGDFEAEHERRRDLLEALAAAGVESPADVRAAIDGHRLAAGHRH
jgi:hypothetical protein